MSDAAAIRGPFGAGAAGTARRSGRGDRPPAAGRGGGAPPDDAPGGGGDAGPGGGRDPFKPRAARGRGRALGLALAAHALLILALAFGVAWHDETPTTVAAELWSATPQAAAPRAVETPPPMPAALPPVPRVVPRPAERTPPPVAAAAPDPQIAIEKARREQQARRDETAAEQARLAKLQRDKAEREAEAKAAREAEQRKSELAKAQQQEKQQKAEKAVRLAEAQAASQARANAERADAVRMAAMREEQLKRVLGQAGATGAPTDTGTAARSSAPSAGYAGRVAARVKPNIVFPDAIDGNPTAVVQVRVGADGTILGKRLTQSSGVKAWDDAVLRAIDRTEMLPLDSGRAPPQLEIGFRPKD